MKKIYFLVGIVIIFIIGQRLMTHSPPKSNLTQISPVSTNQITIFLDNGKYKLLLQQVGTQDKINLIPNFSEKKLTNTIMSENKCNYGVNASFYTKTAEPLGLFYVNGNYLDKSVHSEPLFNGFVSKSKTGTLTISSQPTLNLDTEFIFQAGPVLTPKTKLNLKTDEAARRILLVETKNNERFFAAIIGSDNTNTGPLLVELPNLLNQFPTQVLQAINLDGGSASAFYAVSGINVGELVPVGSFLCGRSQ